MEILVLDDSSNVNMRDVVLDGLDRAFWITCAEFGRIVADRKHCFVAA